MSRGVWFGAGVAAGVYAVVRARRVAEAFTVDGLRDRVGAAFLGARLLAQEIEQGRADAEADLRERYRRAVADQHGPPALPPGERPSTAQHAIETHAVETHPTEKRDAATDEPSHEPTEAPEKGTH